MATNLKCRFSQQNHTNLVFMSLDERNVLVMLTEMIQKWIDVKVISLVALMVCIQAFASSHSQFYKHTRYTEQGLCIIAAGPNFFTVSEDCTAEDFNQFFQNLPSNEKQAFREGVKAYFGADQGNQLNAQKPVVRGDIVGFASENHPSTTQSAEDFEKTFGVPFDPKRTGGVALGGSQENSPSWGARIGTPEGLTQLAIHGHGFVSLMQEGGAFNEIGRQLSRGFHTLKKGNSTEEYTNALVEKLRSKQMVYFSHLETQRQSQIEHAKTQSRILTFILQTVDLFPSEKGTWMSLPGSEQREAWELAAQERQHQHESTLAAIKKRIQEGEDACFEDFKPSNSHRNTIRMYERDLREGISARSYEPLSSLHTEIKSLLILPMEDKKQLARELQQMLSGFLDDQGLVQEWKASLPELTHYKLRTPIDHQLGLGFRETLNELMSTLMKEHEKPKAYRAQVALSMLLQADHYAAKGWGFWSAHLLNHSRLLLDELVDHPRFLSFQKFQFGPESEEKLGFQATPFTFEEQALARAANRYLKLDWTTSPPEVQEDAFNSLQEARRVMKSGGLVDFLQSLHGVYARLLAQEDVLNRRQSPAVPPGVQAGMDSPLLEELALDSLPLPQGAVTPALHFQTSINSPEGQNLRFLAKKAQDLESIGTPFQAHAGIAAQALLLEADEAFLEGDDSQGQNFLATARHILDAALGFTPIGNVLDAITAFSGFNVVTGQPASELERMVATAGIFIPGVFKGVLSGFGSFTAHVMPSLGVKFGKIARSGGKLGEAGIELSLSLKVSEKVIGPLIDSAKRSGLEEKSFIAIRSALQPIEPGNVLNKLGHSFQKHANRSRNGPWGKVSGSASKMNEDALQHFQEILASPGEFRIVKNKVGIGFLEKHLGDGRGIRLNQDGTFKGFIDL